MAWTVRWRLSSPQVAVMLSRRVFSRQDSAMPMPARAAWMPWRWRRNWGRNRSSTVPYRDRCGNTLPVKVSSRSAGTSRSRLSHHSTTAVTRTHRVALYTSPSRVSGLPNKLSIKMVSPKRANTAHQMPMIAPNSRLHPSRRPHWPPRVALLTTRAVNRDSARKTGCWNQAVKTSMAAKYRVMTPG